MNEEKNGSKNYHHITKTERLEIAILSRKKQYSVRDIAEALGRNPGTISKEIRANSVNGVYAPEKAQHKAYVKRKYSKYQGMKIEGDFSLREYVESKLKDDWSPEQIAGRIKNVDTHIKYASYQAVYKFIYSAYGRNLEKCLRYKHKKRTGGHNKAEQLKNRTFIEERPAVVGERARFGDWEGDLIVSGKHGKGILLILHERKSRIPMIEKIMSRRTDIINQRIHEITGGFICFNSLTIDNDISFQKHENLSELIGAPIYFCHPYHAWEKGGVENTNKLIRQYVPKGSDISKFSKQYVREVELKLQNRPRKCLGYKTPMEVMIENNQFNLNVFLQRKTLCFEGNKNTQAVALEG